MDAKKRIILRIFICVLYGFFVLFLPKKAEAYSNELLLTTVVRSSPSPEGQVLGLVRDGTAVEVLDRERGYYLVDCFGMTGYIAQGQLLREGDGYSIRCRSDSGETRTGSALELPEALELRHSLLELAREQLGDPYVYGGESPGGFDCSGLTYYLYGRHGIELHRTASQQLQDGVAVSREGLQVGDLVFFREPGEVTAASHVGIYAGNNQIIHAGSGGICYADLDGAYFRDYYLCARRLVNTQDVKWLLRMPAEAATGALQPGAYYEKQFEYAARKPLVNQLPPVR